MTLPQCSETGYIHFLTASHTGLFCFFLLVHQYTSLPLPVRYKTTWPFSPILYCQKTENVRVDWQYTGSSVPSFGFQPSTDVDEESGICMLYKHTQISSRLLGSLAPIRCHFFWKSRSIKMSPGPMPHTTCRPKSPHYISNITTTTLYLGGLLLKYGVIGSRQ